ncbi:MAG: outer membrane protein [Longimicrobiales bacterium]
MNSTKIGFGLRALGAGIFLAALGALGASAAAAQDIDSPYRFIETRHVLGPSGGYLLTDEGSARLGPASAAYFGARYSIRISGPFAFDAGVAAVPTTRMVLDTVDADTILDVVGEADQTLGLLDAALRFDLTGPRTVYGLLPYAVAGVAVAFRVTGDDALDEDIDPNLRYDPGTSFAGQIGLGVEWLPTDRLSFRLDARDYLWQIEAPQGFAGLGPEVPAEEWVQNFGISLGLGYRF